MNFEPKLEKLVISIALGIHESLQAKKVSDHLVRLLSLQQTPKRTYCKNPVAKWKTRRGTPMGLVVTLRKNQALRVTRLLQRHLDKGGLKYDEGSSSLRGGVGSHRSLGLERYDYTAPQYGFNYTIALRKPGARSWNRRISPSSALRPKLTEQIARVAYEGIIDAAS